MSKKEKAAFLAARRLAAEASAAQMHAAVTVPLAVTAEKKPANVLTHAQEEVLSEHAENMRRLAAMREYMEAESVSARRQPLVLMEELFKGERSGGKGKND